MRKRLIVFFGILFFCLVIGHISYGLFGHQFIKAIYEGKAIGFLNSIIEGQTTHPLEYYLEIADVLFFSANILFCGITFLIFLFALMSTKLLKNRFEWKKRLKLILIVFSIGLLLRLSWLIYVQPVPFSDYAGFRDVAKGLLVHHQFGYPKPSAYRLPMYPVFLSFLMIISTNNLWLSFCNIILSSLLIIFVYLIAMQLTDNIIISLLGALFYAINPTFIFLAPVLASEHLYAALLFFGLFILCQKGKPSIRIILSGIALGLASLTRGEGIFFIPTFLIVGYFIMKKYKFVYLRLAFFILICVIVMLPWYIRNLNIFGPGVGISTTGGINFYLAHNKYGYGWFRDFKEAELKGLSDIEMHKRGLKLGLNYIIKSKKSEFLKGVFKGTLRHYSASSYALDSSLSLPIYSLNTGYLQKQIAGHNLIKGINLWFYILILVMTLFSTVFYSTLAVKTWIILVSIIFMDWFCHSVVFWGDAKYRFVTEIVFCILAGVTLYNMARIIGAGRFGLSGGTA